MARKNKLIQTTCKSCKVVTYLPVGTPVKSNGGVSGAGIRLQAAGSRMSPFLSGADKGGYEMQRLANAGSRKPTCSNCGGKRFKSIQIKVPVTEAIRLLHPEREA